MSVSFEGKQLQPDFEFDSNFRLLYDRADPMILEAASIPLAALTASLALYRTLRLPQPWAPATVHEPIPLLVYGGSSAVGAFAIKLAVASNIHPIVAVAGAGIDYVSSLLDPVKGDVVLDYRSDRADLEEGIRSALSKTESSTQAVAALDTICKGETAVVCMSSIGPRGRLAHLLPLANLQLLDGQAADLVMINYIYSSEGERNGYRDFAYVMMQAFSRGLETGWFRGHPYTNVPGGLCSVGKILADLKAGKASANKYVFNIRETEGL